MIKNHQEKKPSGAPWLGNIPSQWECLKIGSLFLQRKTKVSDKEYPPLSVTKKGILPQLDTAAKSNDGDNRKLVKAGDFVINSRSDRKGSCGVSDREGSVSLINIVLEPNSALSHKYVHYLLRSQPFSEEYYRYGRGIVADLWTTRFSEMKNILIPIPPLSEQDQIVRFLDWKVSSINKLIKTKKWQINSYKELAKAKIESQLNNYPIEKNVLLKNLGMFFKGGGFSRKDLIEDNKYPAILYGDIYTQYEYKTSTINHFIDSDTYTASRKIINGDIVMAGTGETKEEIGKPILYTGNQMVAVGGDIIVFRPYKMGNAEYLLYQLYSQAALKHRYINGKGDIIVHIYPTTLGNTPISLPSDSDQMKAVEKINKIISQTNKTTALLIEEITTLKEFKTRLISDVVTGQIDVRNIEIPEYEYVDEELESDSDDVDGDFDSEDISEEA